MGKLAVLFYEGSYRSAWYFVTADGKNPVLDFIETHQKSRPKDIKKGIPLCSWTILSLIYNAR